MCLCAAVNNTPGPRPIQGDETRDHVTFGRDTRQPRAHSWIKRGAGDVVAHQTIARIRFGRKRVDVCVRDAASSERDDGFVVRTKRENLGTGGEHAVDVRKITQRGQENDDATVSVRRRDVSLTHDAIHSQRLDRKALLHVF